jgi:hypothetical protein
MRLHGDAGLFVNLACGSLLPGLTQVDVAAREGQHPSARFDAPANYDKASVHRDQNYCNRKGIKKTEMATVGAASRPWVAVTEGLAAIGKV